MNYTESVKSGNLYRLEYFESINRLITKKQKEALVALKQREADAKEKQQLYRKQLVDMLGWPLTEYDETIPNVNKIFVAKDSGITIYRLQIETLPGFKFYGILFVREDGIRRPLVISQHGGDGTPELCSSLEQSGSSNYNDMTQRLLNYDVNVFAPQMLLWNTEKYCIKDGLKNLDRNGIDCKLKQLGGSIAALEIYCLQKSLNYLDNEEFTLKGKIGMAGLSYGGFYTLYTAAIDTRIISAVSCSFFNDRIRYNWPDFTWKNSAGLFSDSMVASLVYPRSLYIEIGDCDTLFLSETGRKEYAKINSVLYDKIHLNVFNGSHEFCKDDDDIAKMIDDLSAE